MNNTVEARVQPVNGFSPGTAAPVGPSIPCKAANISFSPPFRVQLSVICEDVSFTQMANNSLFPVSCERVKGCDRHRPIDDLFCCKALHGIDLNSGLF